MRSFLRSVLRRDTASDVIGQSQRSKVKPNDVIRINFSRPFCFWFLFRPFRFHFSFSNAHGKRGRDNDGRRRAAFYRTRLLLRRPVNLEDFNKAGFERAQVLDVRHAERMREFETCISFLKSLHRPASFSSGSMSPRKALIQFSPRERP